MSKLSLFLVLFLLLSCQTQPSKQLQLKKSEFKFDTVAKADIDMFADVLMRQSMGYLQLLARKLYLRNPNQLHRAKINDINKAVARLFVTKWPAALPELGYKRSVTAIQLAFENNFEGDRVAALIAGLRDMLLDAYEGNTEFYLYVNFDPQKIYNLARNFEVAFWKLSHDRDSNGHLFLLSNEIGTNLIMNLSFERLYGKLISLHDQMAIVIAETTNRYIKNIIQSAATMVFLPI